MAAVLGMLMLIRFLLHWSAATFPEAAWKPVQAPPSHIANMRALWLASFARSRKYSVDTIPALRGDIAGGPVKVTTGLGLPLCRGFAQAAGGWLALDENQHDGMTHFWCVVDASRPPPTPVQSVRRASRYRAMNSTATAGSRMDTGRRRGSIGRPFDTPDPNRDAVHSFVNRLQSISDSPRGAIPLNEGILATCIENVEAALAQLDRYGPGASSCNCNVVLQCIQTQCHRIS